MPKRKDISNDLREAIVAAHQSGKGYKVIFKQFGVNHLLLPFFKFRHWGMNEVFFYSFLLYHPTVGEIIHKWKTFKSVVNPPRTGCPSKFTSRSGREMLRERVTSQTLQASVSMLNIQVYR